MVTCLVKRVQECQPASPIAEIKAFNKGLATQKKQQSIM